PYTPYQAEIAQGRLETLFTFQTLVTDLTGMEVATASLLDEPTAAAEAMAMLHRVQQGHRNRFIISETCFPQTIAVVRGRAEPLGITVDVTDVGQVEFDDDVFGLLVQYPNDTGGVEDLAPLIARSHASGVLVGACSDLLALTLLTPPGEMDADVVVGNAQRFGVPLGYGGPHAAFFATRLGYVRQTPGRIIGTSVDVNGAAVFRMALQTREQHIRREKATSSICTAQALLANVSALYAVYHGPDGLTGIAQRVHGLAVVLAEKLTRLGITQTNQHFFDTLHLVLPEDLAAAHVREIASTVGLNFRYFESDAIGIALDETTTQADVQAIVDVFRQALGSQDSTINWQDAEKVSDTYPETLERQTEFLDHPVFLEHHSEAEMMRYIRRLEERDIGLDLSMIPLGSCTMKLNAASTMIPMAWPEFSNLHPFAPREDTRGYEEMFGELENALAVITGLPGVSLQPNSGAQGEFAGLSVIRAYHRDRGDQNRNIVMIPSSAHGTNPASARMAGMQVVVVHCDEQGNVDIEDLKSKAEANANALAALMLTYPSTHGVFEESVRDICDIVHQQGGQVYMDGANMNAQVGLTSPAMIGADVCHLNLHKTFAIPHGGGGPGMGPIAVASHLTPYLPGHPVVSTGGERAIAAVAGAPWGSAGVLMISYAFIRMLGGEGLSEMARYAILNANYVKARLESHYDILYTSVNGRVAHEMILDLRPFKESAGIDEQDLAKRLIDYGFHAPTISFPVAGTMMVEPTESEPLAELDRFCDAMIAIRNEIRQITDGEADRTDNVLKNAPHTAEAATVEEWKHPYTREQAVYPLPFVRANKFWPVVGRIDNAYGDRHLVCGWSGTST
ncbi:MAG: aminomethyl-transferring glycine dehydrogenase, partial [Acidobacteriota bacterium]|nr:aminomethyl-transferring glycine dehydrogenase [Acidobacteriota bacterium]